LKRVVFKAGDAIISFIELTGVSAVPNAAKVDIDLDA